MDRVERNQALARWLKAHDGVISGLQASALGVSPSMRHTLVSSGRWLNPRRGVFVDATTSQGSRTDVRVALCAAGPEAVASHRSAAWLWDLVDQPPARVHITVPRCRRMRLPGIVSHRTMTPPSQRRRAGIPVTEPVRTLIDVAATGAAVGSLIDRALAGHLVTLGTLEAATRVGTGTQRDGSGRLRASLEERGYLGAPSPSVLESRMTRLLVRIHRLYGLPLPDTELPWQVGRQRYRLDFAWPAVMLAVEVDGYAWHAAPSDLDHDTARRSQLTAAGWTILVFTWHQVVQDPERVTATILATFARCQTEPIVDLVDPAGHVYD